MSVLCEYAIVAYIAFFAYFSKVHILHIFPHKLAVLTAILTFFLFLFESIFVVIRKWQTKADVNALSLHLEVEEVVANGIEFTEFEGAYCQYNKCETESEESTAGSSGLGVGLHGPSFRIFPLP